MERSPAAVRIDNAGEYLSAHRTLNHMIDDVVHPTSIFFLLPERTGSLHEDKALVDDQSLHLLNRSLILARRGEMRHFLDL